MKVSVKRLRKMIQEAIADTMMAYTEAPPPSQQQKAQGDHPALRDQSNNKSNQVARIVNQKLGNTSKTQQVQQYVAAMDPQERLVMTAEQIAQAFLQQPSAS
jgi:hypothetical protein